MITEDGTGLATANSYGSIAEALTYHNDRGNTAWSGASISDQTSALIVATDYIETNYTANGYPLNLAQALQWPRIRHRGYDPRRTFFDFNASFDQNGDPLLSDQGLDQRVKNATYILALAALNGPLEVRIDTPMVSNEQELTGVGRTKQVFGQTVVDHYPHVTRILSPIAAHRAGTVWVGRVTR